MYSYSPEFLCPYLLYLTLPSPPWVPLASVLENPGHFRFAFPLFFRSSRRNGGGLVPGGVVRCRWRFSAAVGKSSRRVDPARVIHTTPLAAITHTQHRSHHPLASCNRASCGSQPAWAARARVVLLQPSRSRLPQHSPSVPHFPPTPCHHTTDVSAPLPHTRISWEDGRAVPASLPYPHKPHPPELIKRVWNEHLPEARERKGAGGEAAPGAQCEDRRGR